MKIFAFYKSSIITKAFIPGLVGLTMLIIETIIKNISIRELNISQNELHLTSENALNWLLILVYEVARKLGAVIFEAYRNYVAFLLMMFLLSLILHRSDIIQEHNCSKEDKAAFVSRLRDGLLNQEFMKQIFISFIGYSLIFCFYQVMWIYLGGSISLHALNEMANQPLTNNIQNMALETVMPSRILVEKEEMLSEPILNQESRKPLLSVGRVLGQLNIDALSIKLSKDLKTAFVTSNFPQALRIIDISDPESPLVLSTLTFSTTSYDPIILSLAVSPDQTRLFLSDIASFRLIDIKNFKSPFVVATVEDNTFMQPGRHYGIAGITKPNLLFSRDEKFLFVSGFGLQVFDLSDPTAPALICSLRSRDNYGLLSPSSIALSADKNKLYYSDGGLWIYNIEDPKNMKTLNSFNTTYLISSMIISDDAKTAFILGRDQRSKILLQTLDISDIYSIREDKTILFDQTSAYQPIFIERAPNNRFLLILSMDGSQGSSNLLTFDTQGEYLLQNKKNIVNSAASAVFTEDYKRALIGKAGKLEIVDLYLDYPNKHAFCDSKNILQTFDVNFKSFRLMENDDGAILYSMASSVSESIFRVHQISSENLSEIYHYEVPEYILQTVIPQDNRRVFWVSGSEIIMAEMSNAITVLGKFPYREGTKNRPPYLSLSRDGKTGYLTCKVVKGNYLEIIDFSNPQEIASKGYVDLELLSDFAMPILSNDEKTVFIIANKLLVYNVSDPSNPKLLKSLSFRNSEYYLIGASTFGVLSPDGRALFIKDESTENEITIHTIDVSDVSSPQKLNEFHFPVGQYVAREKFLWVSADSQTLYIARFDSLLVIDVSNLGSPKYLGSIRILEDSSASYVYDFSISKDGRKAYVLAKPGKLHIVGIDPAYSTYMGEDILMLGERYSLDLQVLKMNEYMDYERIDADYRFVKFAMVEPHIMRNIDFEKVSFKMAPSWMNFDLKTQTLSVEARRKSDIGVYQIYFGFSTQVEREVFSGINETIDSEDLVACLLAHGYLDNQLFLTENFGEFKDFILPKEYSNNKKEIFQILKRYSFGTFNELKVVESLNITYLNQDKFTISTTSLANVKVEISLSGGAQFLSRHYGLIVPVITHDKSQLDIEGSLKDINLALQEVVINLGKDVSGSCDGEIIVDDKLNPVRTETVKNISRYFSKNMPPRLRENFNLTIQSQVDKESVLTGLYFQIKLNPYTFFDKYTEVENLSYQLVLVKGNNNETTALPSWLSFSGMTLMGTAPEVILNRDFDFKLVVKNEFQEMRVPFKLHVDISSGFVLKLLMKYSPYILSIVGLLVSANKIFNVVFKGSYKHPKDFYVRSGEEITSEVIFPISFIHEEMQEAKKILRLIEEKHGLDTRNKFLNEMRKIDKGMVGYAIKEITREERKNLGFYFRGRGDEVLHPRRSIHQIIFNTLTNNMLRSSEEKETRKFFEEIKKKWPLFVEWDLINSCFKINNEKLNRLIEELINLEESTILTNDTEDKESGLLERLNINMDLLKDAILAYVFDCHNIDVLPVYVQLNVKERIQTNFFKRFLKLDLKDIPFREKGKIGYGIGYTKEYNTLCFHGVAKSDITGKTIVVQITNLRQKILKELWIFGNEEGGSEEIFKKDQNETQGAADYEIF